MLQKDFHCLDCHGAVAKHRDARDLTRLDQVLDDEDELLGALDGKRRNNHAAAALGYSGDQAREFRQRVLFGMPAVSVSRFHHYDIGGSALHWSVMYDLALSSSLIG